jgi:hypothetical protein
MASVVVLAVISARCAPEPAGLGVGTSGPAVTVALPAGDVLAGRQAFLDLKCTACHAVPSERDFPRPVSGNPGPVIDATVASTDVSYVAAAIMTPSHAISPNIDPKVRANIEGMLSPMGDFSHVMTVRQMVDLHAYLRSIR